MKSAAALVLLNALAAQGIRIVQSNDDGWAELYTRSFFDALTASGNDVVLSAPAENKSGTSKSTTRFWKCLADNKGSSDAEPEPREEPCIYDSCPANSGPVGFDEANPKLNWVNSFPVTSMKYGITERGPQLWNGESAELAVAGPNVGSNVFLAVPFSGTVGASVHAVQEQGIPAIAFSGDTEGRLPWNTQPVPARSTIYAELATTLTNAVIAAGTPYLPEGVWLNVNLPQITEECDDASKFSYVLSRINPGFVSEPDVETCGSDRLPTEADVIGAGCFVSVSVGDAADKTTADAERQAVVLEKLSDLLVCLP